MRNFSLRGRGRDLVTVDDENAQKSDDFYGNDDMNMQQYEAMVRIFFRLFVATFRLALRGNNELLGGLDAPLRLKKLSIHALMCLFGCLLAQVFMSVLVGMFVCCFCSCVMKRLQRIFEASSEARVANEVMLVCPGCSKFT